MIVKYRHFIFVLLILTTASFPVYGGGKREDPMDEARQLVEEKKYNEALFLLAEIVRENPDRLEQVQALIRAVNKVRNQYNLKLEELIRVYQDPNKLDEAYPIIKQLEELEKTPNQATTKSIKLVKQTAEFVYFTKMYNQIMSKAEELLKGGKYGEAVDTYVSGFEIYRNDFYENDVDETLKETVKARVARTLADLEDFKRLEAGILSSREQGRLALGKGDWQGAATALKLFAPDILELAKIRKRVRDNAVFYLKQSDMLKKEDEQAAFYLVYQNRMALGRIAAHSKEGIVGSMDLLMDSSMDELARLMERLLLTAYGKGKQEYEQKQWHSSQAVFQELQQDLLLYIRLTRLWSARIYLSPGSAVVEESWPIIEQELPRLVYYQLIGKAARAYVQLPGVLEQLGTVDANLRHATEEQSLKSSRVELAGRQDFLTSLLERWQRRNADYNSMVQHRFAQDRVIAEAEAVYKNIQRIYLDAQLLEGRIVRKSALLILAPVQTAYDAQLKQIAQAQNLLEGIPPGQQAGEGTAFKPLKYPGRAEQIFLSAQAVLEDQERLVVEKLAALKKEPQHLQVQEPVRQALDLGAGLQQELETTLGGLDPYLKQARAEVLLAQRFKAEADLRLGEAEQAISQQRFALARQKIVDAQNKFNSSLEHQEDDAYRTAFLAATEKLAQQLTDSENRINIAEKRKLITEAKRYYAQGVFDKAEELLIKADRLWKMTNIDDDEEINYWLNIVQEVLKVKSGRTISASNPLYPEMTQLLNLTAEDFLKSQAFMQKGEKAQALSLLDAAEKKIFSVTLAFPYNQEARVLSLKIARLRDQGGFKELFKRQFDQALQIQATNKRDAYLILKDLEAINPAYPGLKSVIPKLEEELGIRQKAVDPVKLKVSDQKYLEARGIVDRAANDPLRLSQAYELLKEALVLNPNNEKAAVLKDQVAARTGERTTVVLAPADQGLFNTAQQLFFEGKYFDSYKLVRELWNNEKNRRYVPLRQLKQNIEARI